MKSDNNVNAWSVTLHFQYTSKNACIIQCAYIVMCVPTELLYDLFQLKYMKNHIETFRK